MAHTSAQLGAHVRGFAPAGEAGEIIPTAPRWDTVPDAVVPEIGAPYSVDMNQFVTSSTPLVNWVLIGGNASATIDNITGVLTIDVPTQVFVLSVQVTNDVDTSESNTFEWEISGVELPTAPEWIEQPQDQQTQEDDIPETYDVGVLVFSLVPITGWTVTPPATIDANGVIELNAALGDYDLIATPTNAIGSTPSDEFEWRLIPNLPVWSPPVNQSTNDSGGSYDVESLVTGEDSTYAEGLPAGFTYTAPNLIANSGIALGTYTIENMIFAENAGGAIACPPFTWEITGQLPVIDSQPDPLVVVEPAGGSFEVGASHPTNATLFYLWTHSFSDASGATTDELVLGSTDQADDGLTTSCRIRAYTDTPEYEVTTNVVALTANRTAPTITVQPTPQSAVEGQSATFSVTATHESNAPLFYEWDHNYQNIVGGILNSTLVVNPTELIDDGEECFVTVYAYAASSPQFEISNVVDLTVEEALQPPNWHTPIPAQNDDDDTLPQSIDVSAYVDDADTYTNNGDGDLVGSILTMPAGTDFGTYTISIVATNDAGSTPSNTPDWVINPTDAVVDSNPSNSAIVEPDGTSFSGSGSHGVNAVAYQWQARDAGSGSYVAADQYFSSASGVTGTTLTLSSTVQSDYPADVRLRIRPYGSGSSVGEVFTSVASLTGSRANPVINTQPPNRSITEGDNTTFPISASHPNGAPLFYQWNHSFDASVSGATSSTLSLSNVPLSDDGKSTTCRVRAYESGNSGNEVVSNAGNLSVEPDSGPPIWGTVPNISGDVTAQTGMSFNANDYVDSNGAEITAWSTTNNNVNITPGGIVTLDFKSSGNNTCAILATNAQGTTQSNNFSINLSPVLEFDHVFTAANGFVNGIMLGGQQGWTGAEGTSFYVVTSDGGYANIPVGDQGARVGLNTRNIPGGLDFRLTVVNHNSFSEDAGEDNVTISIGGNSLNIDPRSAYAVSDLGGEARVNGSVGTNTTFIMTRSGSTLTFQRGGSSPTTPCTPGDGYQIMTMTGSQLGSLLPTIRGVKRVMLEYI